MNKVVKNPSMPAALSPELLKKIDKVGPVQRCGIETINLAVNECHLLLRDGTPALIRRLVLVSNTAMLAMCAELGFRIVEDPGDPGVKTVTLPILRWISRERRDAIAPGETFSFGGRAALVSSGCSLAPLATGTDRRRVRRSA